MAALRSEKVRYPSFPDDFSHPATLASTESAPCDDASQKYRPQFLRSLSEVGSSSEISNWHSLRSTDRTLRRRRTPPIAALRSEKVTPSFSDDFSHPATLASTESAPCDDASQKKR
ncbi:uncharacterized protein LOC115922255 [Strongylocentrotus purpuratus]|uniref:Uncharacterized protein n=1 Tax=Strongylocentrotus purpuratus TaxID=7668 RepID=A0A7M7NHE4_STRPU|nr:uncharacterized protein LOC115922255 [Strongylocentrotus purpuratus]